jgi:FkbM family methyltransferase
MRTSLMRDSFYRSRALKRAVQKFSKALGTIDFQQAILVSPKDSFTFSDGIFLSNKGTDRYFKTRGAHGNRGRDMMQFVESKQIVLDTVIDIGANFGEISLYFSKHSRARHILAVEPSPQNLVIMRENLASSPSDISNIIVAPVAISDKDGEVTIYEGSYSMNSIVRQTRSKKSSQVRALSFESLLTEFLPGKTIDFLKIDVEQAEFLLFDDLLKYATKIRSMLIEFSDPARIAAYHEFAGKLIDTGFACYLNNDQKDPLAKHALDQVFNKSLRTIDIWFVRVS